MNNETENNLKMILIGPEGGVGKSSILRKLMNEPDDEIHRSTFGIDFRVKTLNVNGKKYKIQIIDTYSNEELAVDYEYYLKTCDIILYIYDITKDFKKFKDFFNKFNEDNIDKELNQKFRVLVGNKSEENRTVSFEEGSNFKKDKRNKIDMFFEVSARKGKNIKELFENTTSQYFSKKEIKKENKEEDKKYDFNKETKDDKKACFII